MKLSACRSASRRVSEFAWGWAHGNTDVDVFSGSTEIPFRRNRQEITNVPQFHEDYDRPPPEIISLD
jgi:hypothetical protein